MISYAISGPTQSSDLPAFEWTETFRRPHMGTPQKYDIDFELTILLIGSTSATSNVFTYCPQAVAAPASKFGGAKGGKEICRGQNVKKLHKAHKNLPFSAEIVKFGLILTHLKLFWGKTGGKKIFFGGKMPPMPPPHVALPLP